MNVPHFQQELDYSCLPACVRMVLAYYDDQRLESELRRLMKTRVTGTSPANVMLRLPDIGYEAVVVEASRSFAASAHCCWGTLHRSCVDFSPTALGRWRGSCRGRDRYL